MSDFTRVQKILQLVRDSVADPNEQRWTDGRLIRILNEGQKDIARQTRILKGEVGITMVTGQPVYDLPDDLWLVTRIAFNNKVLPLESFDEMDDKNLCWYTDTGNRIEAMVYDKRDLHKIRAYPIPDDTIANTPYIFVYDGEIIAPGSLPPLPPEVIAQLNILSAQIIALKADTPDFYDPTLQLSSDLLIGVVNLDKDGEGIYGITTSIDSVAATPLFGTVTDIELVQGWNIAQGEVHFSSVWGVITDIRDMDGRMWVWYIRDPKDIAYDTDELELAPLFDTALKYYVIAMAYMDDLDTAYQTKANTNLQLYQREVETVGKRTDQYDGTRATQYRGQYRTAFDD